jgi:hypothetical protein
MRPDANAISWHTEVPSHLDQLLGYFLYFFWFLCDMFMYCVVVSSMYFSSRLYAAGTPVFPIRSLSRKHGHSLIPFPQTLREVPCPVVPYFKCQHSSSQRVNLSYYPFFHTAQRESQRNKRKKGVDYKPSCCPEGDAYPARQAALCLAPTPRVRYVRVFGSRTRILACGARVKGGRMPSRESRTRAGVRRY